MSNNNNPEKPTSPNSSNEFTLMHPAFQVPNKSLNDDTRTNIMELKQYNMEPSNVSLERNKIDNPEKSSLDHRQRRNSLEEYNGDKHCKESDESDDEEIDLTTGGSGCIDYSNNNKN
jgi:hypothetical protein